MAANVSKLSNGIRVATYPMPAVGTVTLGVWFGVGTRHEAAADNGLAHLLEHMAFKGTVRRSAQKIAEEIEDVGGYLNAYTSREITAYYAKVLQKDVGLAVDLLADILQHAVYDEAELERERNVILQEIGQALDTPDDIIYDHFQAVSYPDQPMGRPILGPAEIIKHVTRDQVLNFVTPRYGSDRMVIVAAGAVEHEAFVQLAEQHFATMPKSQIQDVEPARYQGGLYVEAKELEQVHSVLGYRGLPFSNDAAHYALGIYSTLMGGGMASRLFQEVREKRGLAYSIYSNNASYQDCGTFQIYAGTGDAGIRTLLPVVHNELVRAAERGFSPTEIARAKAQWQSSLLMGLESTSACARFVANNLIHLERVPELSEISAHIDAVNADQLQQTAQDLLKTPSSLALLGPKVDQIDLSAYQS
jgi:predicted Zn-dependent peptidase